MARATVLGRIDGLARDPRPESPWYLVYGVATDSVNAVTSLGQCTVVAAAALNAARTPDTLPLLGVVRIGDRGFVVVRASSPIGPGQHHSDSLALLGTALDVRSYQRINY